MIKKKLISLKLLRNPQTDENKVLRSKVLDNVGGLFNGLYYIYKDEYNEEKDGLKTKKTNFFTTKNWDLLMIINTSLKNKKKKKKNNRLIKSLIKKDHLKNQQKTMEVILINGLMKKKQTLTGRYFRGILAIKGLVIC